MKYFLLLLFIGVQSTKSHLCYWNKRCPYKYFSSKTSYNTVRGDIRDSVLKMNGCEPISIWGIYRHGKRNPGIDFAHNMRDVVQIRNYIQSSYAEGKSSLCNQDVENLRDWLLDEKMFDEVNSLTDEGYQDMIGLGKRLYQAFPKLLRGLTEKSYMLRPAVGHWIENSAKGFNKGLANESLTVEKANPLGDDIMSPYKTCEKYQKDVRKNPDKTYAEANKFLKTSYYLEVKNKIQRRTGINYTLTDVNITSLYDLCRYTSSGLDDRRSPWCALFTTEDLKVFEYIGELRHYYRNSYGTPMNEKFGRVPLADLLKRFELAKNGEGKKIVAYFTHATMIDMIYTALHLFRDDEPLTAANRNWQRKWRTSKLSNYSVNLLTVLNRCTRDKSVTHNVVFYLNEKPLRSICKKGTCSWQEFEEKLKPFVNVSLDFC